MSLTKLWTYQALDFAQIIFIQQQLVVDRQWLWPVTCSSSDKSIWNNFEAAHAIWKCMIKSWTISLASWTMVCIRGHCIVSIRRSNPGTKHKSISFGHVGSSLAWLEPGGPPWSFRSSEGLGNPLTTVFKIIKITTIVIAFTWDVTARCNKT